MCITYSNDAYQKYTNARNKLFEYLNYSLKTIEKLRKKSRTKLRGKTSKMAKYENPTYQKFVHYIMNRNIDYNGDNNYALFIIITN